MDYSTISEIVKYAFVVIVYLFIFSISRMIYLDIADAKKREGSLGNANAYLKLVNLRRNLSFKMHESYSIKDIAYIGRNRKCQIFIDDPHLSANHARIFLRDGHFYIEDLGSTNGSYLNGRKLPRQAIRLKDTDKLTFGKISFIFIDNIGSES